MTSELCARVISALTPLTSNFEILLVDDGSSDESWQVISREALLNPRIRGIRLGRNFGQHVAISAGLANASGRWVVVMDCDLQDPPEAIPSLYNKALQGFDIVIASFESRSEGPLRRIPSRLFWSLYSWISGLKADSTHGNFRIMSRRAVSLVCQFQQRSRLLGAMTSELGLPTTEIRLPRSARRAGKSNYSLTRRIRLALNLLNSTTHGLLRVLTFISLGVSVCLIGVSSFVIFSALSNRLEVPGWAGIMFLSAASLSWVTLSVAVLGDAVMKILDQVKTRPIYVIAESTYEHQRYASNSLHDSSRTGFVVWITGLQGSGKTTFARKLRSMLEDRGTSTVLLDGDLIRPMLRDWDASQKYDRESRLKLGRAYARLANHLAEQGVTVLVATVSMFDEIYSWNRSNISRYFEVLIETSVDLRERRLENRMGHKSTKNEILDIQDVGFQRPASPDLTVANESIEDLARAALLVVEKVT